MFALEELLDSLDATRERTLVAIEMLPDEALVATGVVGRWSVADLLTVLTAWDAEVVTALMRLEQGKPPEKLKAALDDLDFYNAARYQDAQGRDLDVIFNDFQSARLHLEEWLADLSEHALANPGHYKALGGEMLGRLIARATYMHEARYLPFLEAYAARFENVAWDDSEASEEMETIPLAGIDILDLTSTGAAPPADGRQPAGSDEQAEMEDDDDDD